MLDPLTTTIWSPTTPYTFAIRNATVSGSTVTVTSVNHFLSTGDTVTVTGTGSQANFSGAGPVTVIDGNRFSYTASSPPGVSELKPTPGQKTNLWLTCSKYSAVLSNPNKLRLQLPASSEIAVETLEDSVWVNQQIVLPENGLTDIIFSGRYSAARLKLRAGATVPTVTSYTQTAPDPTPAATTTFYVPAVEDNSVFHAYRTLAAATLTANTWTLIALNTEVFDTAGAFDSVTAWKFQPRVAAYYQINFSAYLTAGAGSSIASALYKNGTQLIQGTTVYGTSGISCGSFLVPMNGSTDYLQLYGFGSIATVTIQPGANTFLSGSLVRRL